jgi:hypothetical protein
VPVEISFNSQIAKIKRQIILQAIHGVLLNASLIFLAGSAFYFIFNLTGIASYRVNGTWYFVPIGFCVAAACIIGFVTRSSLLNILIDIDCRLKLKDRVSTAYEYLKLKKKTEFTELLINDAAVKLSQINPQQLVPAKFSFMHGLVIILLMINILLYSGVFFTPDFKLTHRELEKIDNAGQVLKNYMIKRIDKRAAQQPKTQSGHGKKLAQISNKLNDSSKSFEQRFAELNHFLEEVQGEQARLAQELGTRLDSADIKKLPIPKTPDLANLSTSQLQKLKGLLSKTLSNRISDAIYRNIESLQELDSIENLLSRIIDDLEDGQAVIDDSYRSAGIEGQTPPAPETPENQPDDPNRPYPKGKFADPNQNAEDRADHRGFGKGQRDGGDLPAGLEPSEGYSNAAGGARSDAENKPGQALEKTPGSAVQDKMVSSAAKTYLIHIRALTDMGDARFKEEDIFRTYRKEVESILQKEDIPVNYREYIKNYFISIGINTEENAHEFK